MRHLLLLLAATAVLLAACDARNTDDAPGVEEASGPFLDMLRLVPDVPEYRSLLYMGDVDRTLGALEIERPSGEYDEAAIEAFVREVMQPGLEGFWGASPLFFGTITPDDLRMSTIAQRSFGFSVLDEHQWLETGVPPQEVSAIRGSFDPDGIASSLETCRECPRADVEHHRGWDIYAWGEESTVDLSNRFLPPLIDHLGRPGRLAVSEQLIVRTHSTDAARLMVDAYEGDSSLADVEDFRLAIAVLQEMDVLTLIASDRALSPDEVEAFLGVGPAEAAGAWEVQPGDTVLAPYEVAAAGDGWDGSHYSVVVLVHASEDDAEENGRRFVDRIASTRVPANLADLVSDVEVTVDGRVLRARIEGNGINRAHFILSSLLLHE